MKNFSKTMHPYHKIGKIKKFPERQKTKSLCKLSTKIKQLPRSFFFFFFFFTCHISNITPFKETLNFKCFFSYMDYNSLHINFTSHYYSTSFYIRIIKRGSNLSFIDGSAVNIPLFHNVTIKKKNTEYR